MEPTDVAADAGTRGRVRVLSLGGTIAMTHRSGDGGGVTPRLTGADLVAAVPGLDDGMEIVAEDFRQVPSACLSIDDVAELAAYLNAAAGDGTGAVVTQGTDTLEETAFLLDLLYTGDAPVVLTGAMRNPSMPGADGPANLLDAVRTAAAPAARARGPLVVFAGDIHAARFVRKTHATSVAAFASANAGPVGHVTEGRPRFHTTLPRTPTMALPFTRPAEAEVVPASLGTAGTQLNGLADRADGAVIAAFGAGHVPADWAERLQELAARIPVVLASRTGSGSVLTATYGFPGSETDLLARGLVNAGPLDPYKARLLLLTHLRTGAGRTAIDKAFAAYR